MMLHHPHRCIYLYASRISLNFHIGISSTRCTYSTLTQQHIASNNELVPSDALFNKHLSDWNIDDVTLWLSRIDNGVYSNYINNFEQQRIDGLSLQYLSENDLNDLGVKIMGDRKHIIHCLNDLFRYYNINTMIHTAQPSSITKEHTLDNERITINIGTDTNVNGTPAMDMVPSVPANVTTEDSQDTSQDMMRLFHPDHLPPMIALPQLENQQCNISDNLLRIEYECPWSIEKFNTSFNAQISQLFLSSPELDESTMDATSTFSCDLDYENDQLILHGNFIELSRFTKNVYKLNDCPILPLLPRISHFLMDCGELQRIAAMFCVIPFLRRDGKLSFYSPTAPVYATDAIDAVTSLLKTLDCSSWFGALNTSIIGTLLSMDKTKTVITTNLARYGFIQYWNRGHSIFEKEYKISGNIERHKIYHLLLMKSFSASNLNQMHRIVSDLLSQHSSTRAVDIGLVSFILYQHNAPFLKDLQQKHGVYIGACPHSKTAYVCGATEKLRQEILSEVCDDSIYGSLSYCKLSDSFQDYVFHCRSLSHFRALKKLHNKQMMAQFVYNEEESATYLVTPSIYESDCNDFIAHVLEPSLLKLKHHSLGLHEYLTLMSKLSDAQQFLAAHVVVSKLNVFVFHKSLQQQQRRRFVKKEIVRYQNMKHEAMNVSAVCPWLRKFLHRMLKNGIQWDSNTALITLLEENQTLNIRCTDRIFDKVKHRFNQITQRVFAVPIYERLHWITHYEMNNNLNLLTMQCAHHSDGIFYIYNRDCRQSIAWMDRYLEIVLRIGLTYNQFPNDEHILQRDCRWLLQIIPKCDQSLTQYESICNFTLLMLYQCVLSTRYDLLLQLWTVATKHNAFIPNALNTLFVVAAKQFPAEDMKHFLIRSKILFQPEMLQFVFKTLKQNHKKEELRLIKDVLQDIHLDTDIDWTFDKISWTL
eukprot:200374_1